MNIKPYLRYYFGCKMFFDNKIFTVIKISEKYIYLRNNFNLHNTIHLHEAKPILRRIASLTEQEIFNLLNIMFPDTISMDERPDIEDYQFEMFYNDDATMVDGDVAIGANYSCRCYEGQIAITYDGTIHMFAEDGEKEKQYNTPKAYDYLHSIGIWLYGEQAFTDGDIIDAETLK